jgi:protease secretion system outer membrane protein
MLRVSSAYVDALFANEQVRLAESQRNAEQEVNDRMFQKGEGTKTDMLETQSKLDLAEASLLETQDNLQSARATLATLVGQEVTQLDDCNRNSVLPQCPKVVLRLGESWRRNTILIWSRRLMRLRRQGKR